eukprot:CAMPEP_0201523316 /NCGR_PEP_ID=MMETSP0161_2-20130828/19412_1 /ASSEMBLY_ACC=CAM_ASM_000251 /TAXON_ID=180227 /ORGANISM="Neoparamoeba aestuarina, Strain SoJaBio B1-5/56/2" /LENGTH=217 /DNA_ID=CAMNT_0047922407 /DNA_START=32 /DNA_END=685 /DNA_ORIENTATION=+
MAPLTAPEHSAPELSTPVLTTGFDLILQSLVSSLPSEECASNGSRFHASKIPKITLSQYFQRIVRYCPSSNTSLIVALIYMYRLVAKCGKSFVNIHTVHRQLMTSVVVASKFCDDYFETNSFYARVGGITIHELNALEIEFLARLNFDLSIKESEYFAYENFVHAASCMSLGTTKAGINFEASLQKKVETVVSSPCSTANLTQIVTLFGPRPAIASS